VVEVILKKGTVEVSISDRASRVLLVKKRGAIGPFRNEFETDFKERDDCLIQCLLKVVLDSCSTSTVTKLKPPPSESDVAGAIDAIKLCSTQYSVLEHR
jgi:hypothetical protein